MKNLILTLAFLILPAMSFAQYDTYSILVAIDSYFASLNGVVVSVDGENVLIDLNNKSNLTPGSTLDIFHEGAEIIHPSTGKSLGRLKKNVGLITVKTVTDNFSETVFKGETAPLVGDTATLETPIKIKLTFDNATDEDNIIIKSFFTNSSKLEKVDSGYRFDVQIKPEDNGVSYTISDSSGKLLHTNYIRVEEKVDNTLLGFTQREHLGTLKGVFGSVAAGKLIAEDKNDYMVLSAEREIRIVSMDEHFKDLYIIDKGFNQILNVEAADLNGNGIDEIFVTNVAGIGNVKSFVYEHSAGGLTELQSGIPFLFRSVRMPDGTRRVFGQKLTADGEYMGEIYEIVFKNGKYVSKEAVLGTLGKRLFGFSMMKSAGVNSDMYLQINSGNQLALSTFKKNEYLNPEYFGDTFRQLITPTYLSTSIESKEGEERRYIYQEKLVSIPPRIEVISDGKFIIVKNVLYTRVTQNSKFFKESEIVLYSYNHGIMKVVYNASQLDPVITDIWLTGVGDSLKLIVLTVKDKSVFSSGTTAVNIYSIKL